MKFRSSQVRYVLHIVLPTMTPISSSTRFIMSQTNLAYYVSYYWPLSVAYIYDELVYNWQYAKPIGNTDVPNQYYSRLRAAFWFKGMTGGGGVADVSYGKYEAYLYYKGQVVADAVGEMSGCEILNRPESNQDSPYGYCLRKFSF